MTASHNEHHDEPHPDLPLKMGTQIACGLPKTISKILSPRKWHNIHPILYLLR